ncbi:MAG: UvrB/UvrC motif-containing protein, partial [Kiritimatiellae bacterium]|nr:UvrB/UvrC motif-containing protein [Kiritimatiellia bacterium]
MLEAAAKQAFERAAQLRDGTRISVLALNHASSALCFADALAFRGRNPETNYDLRFMNYDFSTNIQPNAPT